MATRTQAREAIVGMLYAYDLGNEAILLYAKSMLEEKKIKNKQQDFALNLLKGTISRLEWLDNHIKPLLKNWDISRLGGMERSILRLGAYEILCTDTDIPVIINEAIELGKHYGSEDNTPKLLNGVLDTLSKTKRDIKDTIDSVLTKEPIENSKKSKNNIANVIKDTQ